MLGQTNKLMSFPILNRFCESLIVPGLGQYHNDQSWKIPIIYGLLGGLSYYSVYLTKQYHDYKAAYYNAVTDHDDLRFGPTPERLIGANTNQLKNNRNFLRNRRDLVYVTVGLAYAKCYRCLCICTFINV